jgi:hypothetical protein
MSLLVVAAEHELYSQSHSFGLQEESMQRYQYPQHAVLSYRNDYASFVTLGIIVEILSSKDYIVEGKSCTRTNSHASYLQERCGGYSSSALQYSVYNSFLSSPNLGANR